MNTKQENLSQNIKKNLNINDFIFNKKEFFIEKKNKSLQLFEEYKISNYLKRLIKKYDIKEKTIKIEDIILKIKDILSNNTKSIDLISLINSTIISLIELEPKYSFIAAGITKENIINKYSLKINNKSIKTDSDYELEYRKFFIFGIKKGVEKNILNESLLNYDLEDLSKYLKIERDNLLNYTSTFTIIKRYLIKADDINIESIQGYWMRIAMGLAINEKNKQEIVKSFYDLLSNLLYIPSTPTSCHSGLKIAQLSSCYLNVVYDDLSEIFKNYSDSAQLAKWSGGIGTSWSHVRATGAFIKKIRLESQGIIPYLKITDDIVSAVSKTGIRRGATAVYLENWHYDIEDFLDLRKNTGDHRRRTHDLNTALWISDLFMKRVINNEDWSLFSPDEVPNLLKTYGTEFETEYLKYEDLAKEGKIKLYKKISAKELWKKSLMRLFETGHPWITFKDPCNIRSPQSHCGIINSSNLCTEITLNTSSEETAVCNLGSINLSKHLKDDGSIDYEMLQKTVKIAIRMLDNVIDINFYPIKETKFSNEKHRPIGLGVMGWQDLLFKKKLAFEDEESSDLCDEIMENISYFAIEASSDISFEKGSYESYKNSKWDNGIFPYDTIEILEKNRNRKINVDKKIRLNWNELKNKVKIQGMRNSNLMAIAPTATISTIAMTYPSIEPLYKNLYAKSNLTGEFTIINEYLIEDLKKEGLWNIDMLNLIKYYDGSIQNIDLIPEKIRKIYKTSFEIDQKIILKQAALRGKWIDQSQSINIFFASDSGSELENIYINAWNMGLKTTYYCRTLGKSQLEKVTLDIKDFKFTQIRGQKSDTICSLINGGECESCQ